MWINFQNLYIFYFVYFLINQLILWINFQNHFIFYFVDFHKFVIFVKFFLQIVFNYLSYLDIYLYFKIYFIDLYPILLILYQIYN